MDPSFINPTDALDLIAGNNIVILAAVPVGFAAADASGRILEPVLAGHQLQIEDVLGIFGNAGAERLDAEVAAAGSLTEALALLLDECVRAGTMLFDDLLVHFAIPRSDGSFQHKLILSLSAELAAATMIGHAEALLEARAGAVAEDE